MRPQDPDSDLARLFSQLNRADEASAPAFHEAMAGARQKGQRVRRPRALVRAAIASAALAALAAVALLRRLPEQRPPVESETLSAWKAPTDVFLQTAGAELLSRQPVLAPSLQKDIGFDRLRPLDKTQTATPHS